MRTGRRRVFGCTYEAEHVLLEERVSIKEFFVKDFCNRDATMAHVTVGTPRFDAGRTVR